MAGYGRGHYGGAQLEGPPTPPQGQGRSWFTIAAVVGLGAAAAWYLWPRTPASDRPLVGGDEGGGGGGKEPEPPPPSPPAPTETKVAEPFGALRKQLEDDARERGFLTVADYEDSVVANARGLQDTGAKVVLAPNLQHLASRLERK